MAFLDWTPSYELGLDVVDQQHQNLFDLLNKLYDATVRGDEQSVLGNILDELVDYTVEHFQTEEDIFLHSGYAGADQHKAIHDKLTEQAVDLQQQFRTGSVTISFDLLDFLNNWLVEHTMGEDRKMADYINASSKG